MNNSGVVHKKGLSINSINNNEKEKLLFPFVGQRDNYDDFKIYKGVAYTDELDRDGEQATHEYLVQLASKLVGCPIIKNHDWCNVDGIVGRVLSSEIIIDDEQEFIQIVFYAIKPEDIASIDNGLYYGLSVGSCVSQDGNLITSCNDAYEVSLVVVPSVPGAHITKSKKNGGDPEMGELDTLKAELESVKLELEEVKSENEELKTKLAEAEQREFETEAEELLEDKACKAADEMEPANDTVKGYIIDELKSAGYTEADSSKDAVHLKCGKFISFKDFDTAVSSVKTKYSSLGLLGKNVNMNVNEKSKVETKSFNFTPGKQNDKATTFKRGSSVTFRD